ncbi:hypothetical protein F511_20268 [Dorcoceras hygrometricum]|uniref:RING-type domain-containing protein n=1 Tax=Dorcoceras hygrometricum TaxID=472368 RepID=A0A2Z7BP95_9LAMI|nr:hypothetical protein F511_20268 [Dorcoceras hygrometricum]
MPDHVLGIATQVFVMAIIISVIFLFVGLGLLVLIRVCIVGRMLRRGEPNGMVERGGFGSTSMSQEDIEKLPCFDFEEKEKGSSPLGDCAVCLENFRAGEKCRLLPLCNHSFHAECVDSWLLRSPICPICRACADVVNVSESLLGEETSSEVQTAENGPGNEAFVQISDCETGSNRRFEIVDFRGNRGIGNVSQVVVETESIERQENV